ncbi:hypothetical protein SAMN05444414_10638 [Roseovarius marisflavi]|uniref:Uncharacterized protein n=1 Tax=Roseovarius marisflavi TaxID=1054996 RepID=A0A1M6Y9Y1_9RHOB|nr:hypothetical protein [Roseovarius marisflavi]SHL14815.1 hypothetical protein SAMN05444414_10638 [Roseovarius marisflavi]
MEEYFYTLDMGSIYGPKLEALAEKASFDDVEAFAAMILAHALDDMVQRDLEEDQAERPDAEFGGDGWRSGGQEMDDDIPF